MTESFNLAYVQSHFFNLSLWNKVEKGLSTMQLQKNKQTNKNSNFEIQEQASLLCFGLSPSNKSIGLSPMNSHLVVFLLN